MDTTDIMFEAYQNGIFGGDFETDPYGWFNEGATDNLLLETWLIDEAGGASKGNIISKLFGIIKRIWQIITAKFRQITGGMTRMFSRKEINDTTLDQIAATVLGDDGATPPDKHLKFTYANDNQIRIDYVANTARTLAGQPEIAGHDKDDRAYQKAIALVFNVVKHPELIDPLIEMMEQTKSANGEISFDLSRARKAIDAIWVGTVGPSLTCSLEQWTSLNDRVVRFNKALEILDDDTFGAATFTVNQHQMSSEYASIVNEIGEMSKFLQIGVNLIGDGMRQVYALDSKYHNRINASNFREKLPQFTKMCVEGNIPSKYIHHAIRQICDVSINAKPSDPSTKADENGTLTGNGRFVIFPGDPSLQQYVIKVGYNGLGMRGNRNEFMVWNRVKDIPEISNKLYQITDIGDRDHYIILCERANPIKSWDGADQWNKEMYDLCVKNNVGFAIRCNAGGFANRSDGSVVCVDYGNVRRI